MADDNQTDLTALTVQLVSAFVSNNTVASDSLADLIKTTRAALTVVPTPAVEEPAAPIFAPAVSVRKSLSSPEHIISLIDGKPYKTLKRHLAANNLTPEQYRERYKLPKTYPLVAPSYSDSRRAVAEKIGHPLWQLHQLQWLRQRRRPLRKRLPLRRRSPQRQMSRLLPAPLILRLRHWRSPQNLPWQLGKRP
jgi:predicted transcriptional regulator